MSQAIILGDVHLGKSMAIGKVGLGSALNSRIADQLNLLDWTLDQAIEHNADHIIITGNRWTVLIHFPYSITWAKCGEGPEGGYL
jgi:hypothetical protein